MKITEKKFQHIKNLINEELTVLLSEQEKEDKADDQQVQQLVSKLKKMKFLYVTKKPNDSENQRRWIQQGQDGVDRDKGNLTTDEHNILYNKNFEVASLLTTQAIQRINSQLEPYKRKSDPNLLDLMGYLTKGDYYGYPDGQEPTNYGQVMKRLTAEASELEIKSKAWTELAKSEAAYYKQIYQGFIKTPTFTTFKNSIIENLKESASFSVDPDDTPFLAPKKEMNSIIRARKTLGSRFTDIAIFAFIAHGQRNNSDRGRFYTGIGATIEVTFGNNKEELTVPEFRKRAKLTPQLIQAAAGAFGDYLRSTGKKIRPTAIQKLEASEDWQAWSEIAKRSDKKLFGSAREDDVFATDGFEFILRSRQRKGKLIHHKGPADDLRHLKTRIKILRYEYSLWTGKAKLPGDPRIIDWDTKKIVNKGSPSHTSVAPPQTVKAKEKVTEPTDTEPKAKEAGQTGTANTTANTTTDVPSIGPTSFTLGGVLDALPAAPNTAKTKTKAATATPKPKEKVADPKADAPAKAPAPAKLRTKKNPKAKFNINKIYPNHDKQIANLVRDLQQYLGFPEEDIDGIFGGKTLSAVRGRYYGS